MDEIARRDALMRLGAEIAKEQVLRNIDDCLTKFAQRDKASRRRVVKNTEEYLRGVFALEGMGGVLANDLAPFKRRANELGLSFDED